MFLRRRVVRAFLYKTEFPIFRTQKFYSIASTAKDQSANRHFSSYNNWQNVFILQCFSHLRVHTFHWPATSAAFTAKVATWPTAQSKRRRAPQITRGIPKRVKRNFLSWTFSKRFTGK